MSEQDFSVLSFMEKLDDAQVAINHEREQLESKATIVLWAKKYVSQSQEKLTKAYKEINGLKDDIEELLRQLSEEKKQKADLEMKLAEMGKLLTSVAKKSSEEGIQKALQTFVNYSKRKTPDKRTYIKTQYWSLPV